MIFFSNFLQKNYSDLRSVKDIPITEPPRHVLNTLLVLGNGVNLTIRIEAMSKILT